MKQKSSKIIVSVTNDLCSDQRVHKVCTYLQNKGFEVLLVGRILPDSLSLERSYRTKRFKLFFNKNAFFYAEYNIRLFCFLLFSKFDVLVANDLDTLPANYYASKLKSKKIVYDSHELFTEVPELQNNAFAKNVWLYFEKKIFPKLQYAFTVNNSIATEYKQRYHKDLLVVRNISSKDNFPKIIKSRSDLNLPLDKKIIIIQGAGINVDRGAEECVEAMQFLDNCILLIAGNGDVIPQLKQKVIDLKIQDRVIFKNKMPYNELIQYTGNSDLGIILDKDTNLNYRYSLPNKIFDYIHAGIPVLASNLPEISNIINHYNIGIIVKSHQPKDIAAAIAEALNKSANNGWKANLQRAASELTWENEIKELDKVYSILA